MQQGTSIIIPVHNCLDYTKMCIKSIYEHTADFEIIVVDNGSSEETTNWLFEQAIVKDNFGVVRNEENKGFARAVNQGVKWTTHDTICILNNDTIVTPKWLERLRAHLEVYDIIGPCSNFVAGKQLVIPGTYIGETTLNAVANDWYKNHKGEVELVRWIIGICMVMPKGVFEAVGGFDERYGIGNAEDIDFCLTATKLGFQCVIAKDVFIHHFGHATFKEIGVDVLELCRVNNEKLYNKWKDDLKGNVVDFRQELVFEGI